MSWHRFTIDVYVDDEALDEHDGEAASPPNEIDDWDARDIFDAADKMIVEAGECEIRFYDGDVTAEKEKDE